MIFDAKVVLVTGASSGIGADAARHLAQLGARVSIIGRNKDRLYQVADEIKNAGSPTPLAIVADITKDAERIVDETIKHFGQLDVLVNNAGTAKLDTTCDLKISNLNRTFETNVLAVIILTQLCVPYLEKTKGNVINVSSIAGFKPIPNHTSYCVSKAAQDQFTKCASIDLAKKGIRVNAINPSFIRTPVFERTGVPIEAINKLFADLKSKYPVGRTGEVSDTSAAIAFMADNNAAGFLTGILLPVDGGAMVAGVAT